MKMSHIPRKAVCVPGAPSVDISGLTRLMDHPLVQKLRGRSQLGVNCFVFPGAVHSRLEHTVGVLGLTQRLIGIHGIEPDLARQLEIFAILHDIGHGPFSHQIEPVLRGSHHDVGLSLLADLESEIVACGGDVQQQYAFFTGADPAAAYVTDRNLGTDKLDYLYRDAWHIGFSGMPDIENLLRYSVFDGEKWKIEEKFIEDIKRIQKFYSYLHQHGYLGKTALCIQRLFQRAVQERLEEDPQATPRLWAMDDRELLNWMDRASPSVKRLLERFDNRSFHRTVGVVKPVRYGYVERRANRSVVVQEWSRTQLETFCNTYDDCNAMTELENVAASALGLEPGEVLFAAMPYFERLLPRDVTVFSVRCGGEYSLFENDRDHYRSLVGDYLRTFAVRLAVVPEKQEMAAGKVRDFLHSLMH